jgi:Trypsin-co-occurring domain 1
MGNIIEVDTDDGKILVESTDKAMAYRPSERGPGEVGARTDWIKKKLGFKEDLIKTTMPVYKSIVSTFEGLDQQKPDSAEAELALGFSAEGNLFFVKLSGEATIKLTIKWDLKKSNANSTGS